LTEWRHSIELAPGEVTPGRLDARAAAASKVPLPQSLAGKRCLDAGTGDGFWAFEMERRGAAEVVAIDTGDRTAFDAAHAALRSTVERQELAVGDLDPTRLGHFDVVFAGSLLRRQRDPVLALERLRSVCAGTAVIVDTVELLPSLRFPRTPVARLDGPESRGWWQPNRAALLRMIQSAGFAIDDATRISFVPAGEGQPRRRRRALPRKLGSAQGREQILAALLGAPHVAVRATPA
jgi:tRNA (mo5U34)-methyltransferase